MSGPHTLFNESYQASGALTRQRFVTQDGDQKVKRSDALGQRAIGVCGVDVSADEATKGKSVHVATLGSAWVEASAAITRGDRVTTTADGRAATVAAGQIPLGIARKAAGAAGDLIVVFLTPGLPAA